MENASKALLIAAAVLIVILVIAFAMRVFNSSGESAETAANSAKAISNQTARATEYTGNTLNSILDIH